MPNPQPKPRPRPSKLTKLSKLYDYNGAPERCASCHARPGAQHKASCFGGCHDITIYKPHAFRGTSRTKRCTLCGTRRNFGVHISAKLKPSPATRAMKSLSKLKRRPYSTKSTNFRERN